VDSNAVEGSETRRGIGGETGSRREEHASVY
jgi:hypothetical protein